MEVAIEKKSNNAVCVTFFFSRTDKVKKKLMLYKSSTIYRQLYGYYYCEVMSFK